MGGRVGGGQGGCERRIEVFAKIKKKMGVSGGVGVGGWGCWFGLGVGVDVNEELKFLGKFTKKSRGRGGGVERGVQVGSGWWGGGGVDVNAILGVVVDVG